MSGSFDPTFRSVLRWNSLAFILIAAMILYGLLTGRHPSAIVTPPGIKVYIRAP